MNKSGHFQYEDNHALPSDLVALGYPGFSYLRLALRGTWLKLFLCHIPAWEISDFSVQSRHAGKLTDGGGLTNGRAFAATFGAWWRQERTNWLLERMECDRMESV